MRITYILIMLLVSSNTFAHNNVKNALEQFAWEKRQLIVFTPNKNHQEYKNYRQLVKFRKLELDDRKLLTWHVINNDKVKLDSKSIHSFSNQEIRKAFKVELNEFRIILIGYDQGEKIRLERVDFEFIFSKIDQMPMRLQEMQNNN